MTLGFLINTPTMIGPDETFHIDRVIAAAHGDLLVDAGDLRRSQGSIRGERKYVQSWMKRGGPSQAEFDPIPRDQRASLNQLGGNERKSDSVTNYLTQHPPLYYDVMGAAMWLLPGADDMPLDQLVWYLRAFNALLILSLPIFFWLTAKELFGRASPITAAAAFLPAMLAGLSRIAATVNNDNLAIVVGAVIFWLSVRVMRGDTSVRTAVWLSAVTVVGSLTKLTVMALAVLVVAAYVVRWIRDRRFPPWRTIAVMCVGGALSLVWWVKNLMMFDRLVPGKQAWGKRWDTIIDRPRPANKPPDFDHFWDVMFRQLPKRIWSSLGLMEPPQIPNVAVIVLCGLAVVTLAVAVAVSRGVRWEIIATWGMTLLIIALMVRNSAARYAVSLALAGIQGRYIYPTAIGLLLPFAITVAWLLRRHRRWTPTAVAVLATALSGWGLYLSAEYTWLHRSETLTPANLGRAVGTLSEHFPFAPPAAQVLIVIATASCIAGLVLAVRCSRAPATPVGPESGRDDGPDTTVPIGSVDAEAPTQQLPRVDPPDRTAVIEEGEHR